MSQLRKFRKRFRACWLEEGYIIWRNVLPGFKPILGPFGREECSWWLKEMCLFCKKLIEDILRGKIKLRSGFFLIWLMSFRFWKMLRRWNMDYFMGYRLVEIMLKNLTYWKLLLLIPKRKSHFLLGFLIYKSLQI